MKKNYNNNGYTLVELMLTLLIFSVIMVSIIAVMRTAIVSYKSGLIEASVQQDAQIAVNQLSNILVDAAGFSAGGDGNAIANPWSFTHPTYGNITITFDSLEGNLNLSGDLIAQHVTDFRIKGLYKTDDPATKPVDNSAVICLTVDDGTGAHEYTVEKVVYFRNNVENIDNSMYDVNGATGGEETVVLTGGVQCTVNRFEEVDLTAKYGIVSVEDLDATTSVNYEFVNGKKTANATPDNNPGIKIRCKGTIMTVDWDSKSIDAKDPSEAGCNKVVGYNSNGDEIVVVLSTPKAKVDSSIGLIEYRATKSVNNGFHTTVPVEGIAVYDGIESGKLVVHVKQTFKADSHTCTIEYDAENAKKDGKGNAAIGNLGKQMTFDDSMKALVGESVHLALVGDPNNNALVITTANDAMKDAGKMTNPNIEKEVIFEITMYEKNDTGTLSPARYKKTHTFDFVGTGESLEVVNN